MSHSDGHKDHHLEGIAIVGMSCRFPGAKSMSEFWGNLCEGRESITFFSEEELKSTGIPEDVLRDPKYVKAAPMLDDIDLFDASFFKYSPREAKAMDPQQRLFLECAWETIENAGYVPDHYAGTIGVYAGSGSSVTSYLLSYLDEYPEVRGASASFQHLGNDKDFIPTKVSYKLNLKGPSVAAQTACSTSLVTVHLACQALQSRECDMALAGGICIRIPHRAGYLRQQHDIFSDDGHCRAFDEQAKGILFGSGLGLVLLKPLENAIEDNDSIYAVIKGSAINNDGGEKISFTASSFTGQVRCVADAFGVADIKPETISYIEAHGTGTAMGDPIEISALTEVFRSSTQKNGFCAIGSVKNNIGHADSAAGIASLIKTALALKHKVIPPHINFEKPNPRIDFEKSPFYVNTHLLQWKAGTNPRRACVNSLGIGGTNAFVVMEEAPRRQPMEVGVECSCQLLCLSAKNDKALQELVGRYVSYLASYSSESLADICFTSNAGRSHFEHRIAVVAESAQQLHEKLSAYAAGKEPAGLLRGEIKGAARPKVAFLFTGQGSQYVGMGRELYETQPTFRKALERCDEILKSYLKQPLLSVLYPDEEESSKVKGRRDLLDETAYTQPALFALEYALAELWRSWGIRPDVVMGHSVGEYVAACIAGVFSLEDGLKLIAKRAQLMQALPKGGEMAAVFADEARVDAVLAPYNDEVSIAAYNASEEIVISGARKGIQAILKELEAEGINAQRLTVSHAFHSPLMEPMLAEFEQAARAVEYSPPQIGFISNVTGEQVDGEVIATAEYWKDHIRKPVRFAQSMQTLNKQGHVLFVELGPSPILLGLGRRCLPEVGGEWLPSLRRGKNDWQQLLETLASLYVQGLAVDWSGFDKDYPCRRIPLPTYPFQRQRYWIKTRGMGASAGRAESGHELLGVKLDLAAREEEVVFESEISGSWPEYLGDHRVCDEVVLPGSAYVELGLSAVKGVFGDEVVGLEGVAIEQALVLATKGSRRLQVVVKTKEREFEVYSSEVGVGSKPWVLHARGKITDTREEVGDHEPLDSLRERLTEGASVAEFYEGMRQSGLQFGDRFQTVEKLFIGDGEVLGEVRLGSAVADEGYLLHPTLLDGCFQILAALNRGKWDSGVYLPIGIEKVWLKGPVGPVMWGHGRLVGGGDGEIVRGQVTLYGEQGKILGEVTGLQLKRVSEEALRKQFARKGSEEWLYELVWKQQQLKREQEVETGRWLILSEGKGEALAEKLQARGHHCDVARAAEYRKYIEGNEEDKERYRGVIHLLSLECSTEPTEETLKTDLERNLKSALELVQLLSRQKQAACLVLVTERAQAVKAGETVNIAQAPLWGMGRVITAEHPELGCLRIDVDSYEDELDKLCDELEASGTEDEVGLYGGERYVARLAKARVREEQANKDLIHGEGSYLISGGLGALGLLIGKWLAGEGARQVVLMGRRAPSEAAREAIEEMKKVGATVEVVRGDVTKRADVRRALKRIRKSGGKLKGVVHAAGTLDDGVLIQQNWERFEKVLWPKVLGGWNLYEETKKDELDFFVNFSSMASMLGNPGQGNYAAANAFLDAMGQDASSKLMLSINWGGVERWRHGYADHKTG